MDIVVVRDVKNSSQLEIFLPPTALIIEVIIFNHKLVVFLQYNLYS